MLCLRKQISRQFITPVGKTYLSLGQLCKSAQEERTVECLQIDAHYARVTRDHFLQHARA